MSYKEQLQNSANAGANASANMNTGGNNGGVYGFVGRMGNWFRGLGDAWRGNNQRRNEDALHDIGMSEAMTDVQSKAQRENLDYAINANSPTAQMQRMRDAGLNPALMYGGGGAGGSTAMPSSGMGQSAKGNDVRQTRIAEQGMGLQLAKLASEIKVNESIANANNAGAKKSGSEQKTIDSNREMLLKNLELDAENKWMENNIIKFKANLDLLKDGENFHAWDENFGEFWINADSALKKEITQSLLKTAAEIKATGQQGDAAELNALINELNMKFNTGKDVDWKNVGELVSRFVPLLLGIRK